MPTPKKQLEKKIRKESAEWLDEQPAWLGDFTHVVTTNVAGIFNARIINSKVVKVYNQARVPPTYDLYVKIGRKRSLPQVWQIIEVLESYTTPAASGQIEYHHAQHEFPAGDTVWVNRKQITALTAIVSDGPNFLVTVFGAFVRTATGLKKISNQTIDLSSYVPAEGAVYANIETDNNGALSVETGTEFGGPTSGDVAYIATPSTGKYIIAVVLLYAEQTELLDSQIIVPMPIQTSASGSSDLGWINVMDYGAVGDGSTNDTTAITAAISALPSSGGVLYFPPGSYLTSGGFTISVPALVLGCGAAGWGGTDAVSEVLCSSATAVLFTVSADKAKFENIAFRNTAGSTPSAGSAIFVTSANVVQRVDYESCSFYGFYTNVDVGVGANWVMHGCSISAPVLYGMRIRNTVNHDAGDWAISDCHFYASVRNATAGIRYESSGGGKISNCKFNSDTVRFTNSIDIAPSAADTGNVQIVNCSLENVSGDGIHVAGSRWHDIIIYGCEFGISYVGGNNVGQAIDINDQDYVIVANCTLRGGTTPVAIALTNVNHARLVGNINITFSAMSSTSGCTDVIEVGGVTSVALSMPAEFSVAGSPITSAGTLAVTKATQNANLIYAGPSSGAAAEPTFRGLTTDDMPSGIGGGGGAGQVTGLARWNSGGGTTFDLPDVAEYLLLASDNGSIVDPTIYSLSSDRTQIVFDSSITAGHIVAANYIVAQV
jgi:hypothetical protein